MSHKELLKGNTKTLLLSVLADEPMYGYRIVKEMERRSRAYFLFKEGTLYPALHRLETEQLVKGMWEEADSGVPRRYYHITPNGQTVLQERTREWKRFSRAVNSILLAQAR